MRGSIFGGGGIKHKFDILQIYLEEGSCTALVQKSFEINSHFLIFILINISIAD